MHDLHVIHRLNAERAGREAGHAMSSGELIAHLDANQEAGDEFDAEHAASLEVAFDRGLRRGREEE